MTLYDELFKCLYNSLYCTQKAYENRDVEENLINFGRATAYASILKSAGFDLMISVAKDKGYLSIPYFTLNGIRWYPTRIIE